MGKGELWPPLLFITESWPAWSKAWQPFGTGLLLSNEPDEHSHCSCDISAFSAIEMLCVILRYINFLFYSILFYSILFTMAWLKWQYWKHWPRYASTTTLYPKYQSTIIIIIIYGGQQTLTIIDCHWFCLSTHVFGENGRLKQIITVELTLVTNSVTTCHRCDFIQTRALTALTYCTYTYMYTVFL